MQNYGKWIGASAIALAALTTVSGCTTKNGEVQPATTEQIDKTAANVSSAAANTAKDVGKSASNAASSVSNVVSNAATNTGKAIEGAADAAVQTPKIKTALANNASLAGSNINVDTKGAANTVNLTGTVKNAAQKTLAGRIAQQAAGAGFKVNNQLTMAGGKMGGANKKS
ncbi:MAG TPA: BON domain-containing protein [Abditibacteriaceae bacterium]|jgi:osmotically-inducible protein OsmY|nr:BON domain-containing protein [Abditibacteriaceae bacterium]